MKISRLEVPGVFDWQQLGEKGRNHLIDWFDRLSQRSKRYFLTTASRLARLHFQPSLLLKLKITANELIGSCRLATVHCSKHVSTASFPLSSPKLSLELYKSSWIDFLEDIMGFWKSVHMGWLGLELGAPLMVVDDVCETSGGNMGVLF
jgi:hypothetical protein